MRKERLISFLRRIIIASGLFFIACCLFALTTGPFYLMHWLATSKSKYLFKPEYLIVLGGVAMPSESALMRAWYAQELAKKYPDAVIIVSQLSDDTLLRKSEAYQIGIEINMHGIDSTRLRYVSTAHNTKEEALIIKEKFNAIEKHRCVLISTPEHLRRAVLCFRKEGFKQIGAEGTFGSFAATDYRYKDRLLGGRNIPGADVGESMQLRYQFWNHLKYQVVCYRELVALGWYKLKGWI